MTTFEKLTIAAAFSGLGLSILNLILLYLKDFRKPKLILDFELTVIKEIDEGILDYQFNIRMKSLYGNSFIKEIYLWNPNKFFFEGADTNRIDLDKGIPFINDNLLAYGKLKEEEVNRRFVEGFSLRDLEIKKNTVNSITLLGRIIGQDFGDGSRFLPCYSWVLCFDCGNQIIEHQIKEK